MTETAQYNIHKVAAYVTQAGWEKREFYELVFLRNLLTDRCALVKRNGHIEELEQQAGTTITVDTYGDYKEALQAWTSSVNNYRGNLMVRVESEYALHSIPKGWISSNVPETQFEMDEKLSLHYGSAAAERIIEALDNGVVLPAEEQVSQTPHLPLNRGKHWATW